MGDPAGAGRHPHRYRRPVGIRRPARLDRCLLLVAAEHHLEHAADLLLQRRRRRRHRLHLPLDHPGFLVGTIGGSLLGLSFWWSRNYARDRAALHHLPGSIPKLALAPLIILVFGMGLASKVVVATALTLVVSTLTAYAGVQAVDPRSGTPILFARRHALAGVLEARHSRRAFRGSSRSCASTSASRSRAHRWRVRFSQHGLGRAILYAGQTYEIALVWVAVLSSRRSPCHVRRGRRGSKALLKGIVH